MVKLTLLCLELSTVLGSLHISNVPNQVKPVIHKMHSCGQMSCRTHGHLRGAFDSAKNHKRQRRKRPVRNRQTRKVADANVRIG